MNSLQRIFQFSGFQDNNFVDILKQKVKSLKGYCVDDDCYNFNCTHLICFKFIRTEKVLCALAAGRFVVSSDYIFDSHHNGQWLKESDYEWPNKFQNEVWLKLKADSLIQNCDIVRQTNRGLFYDWKAAVVLKDYDKNLVFKRVLLAGQAEIVDLKCPLSRFDKINLFPITHIFCEKETLKYFKSVQHICIHTDYIINYIFRKNSAKVEEFLTSKYDPKENPLNCIDSKRKFATNDINYESKKYRRHFMHNNEKIKNGARSSAPNQKKNVISGPLDRFIVKKECDKIYKNISCPTEKFAKNFKNTDAIPSQLTDQQISVSLDELLDQILFKWEDGCKGDEINKQIVAEELAPTYTIYYSSMNMLDLISWIRSLVSVTKYPSADVVGFLLWNCILTDANELLFNDADQLLHSIISLHPPSAEMQDYYQRILCYEIPGHCYLDNSNWKNILRILNFHEEIDFKSCDDHFQKNRQLAMRAILRILECNLLLVRKRNLSQTPLIVRLTWPNGVYINNIVLDLIKSVTNLVSLKDKYEKFSIVKQSVRLLGLLTSCCQLYNSSTQFLHFNHISVKVSSAVIEFSKWLASRVHASCFDYKTLHLMFSLLPHWLNVLIINFKLNHQCSSFSLDQLLSLISQEDTPFLECETESTNVQTVMHEVTLTEKTAKSHSTSRSCSINVNKRNHRGETPLHLACIKGDHEKVAKLLSCPGIDVNAKDYAGWTPIHEAANHGSIECVKKLLSYKSNNVDKYFRGTSTKCDSVDLTALGQEDYTPLHDAIANNHVEVAMLILHKGGPKLLEMKTKAGDTPKDLAVMPIMKSALEEFINKQTTYSKPSEINALESRLITETKFNTLLMESDDFKAQFILIYHYIIGFYSFTKILSSRGADIEKMSKTFKFSGLQQKEQFNNLKQLFNFKNRIHLEGKENDVFNTIWILFESTFRDD